MSKCKMCQTSLIMEGYFFCDAACENVFQFIKAGKRDREEGTPPLKGDKKKGKGELRLLPGNSEEEESILWRDNDLILWQILYNVPLKRLGLMCVASKYIRTVCRDIRFRRGYLNENHHRLEQLFFPLLDHDPPLETTFILWATLAQDTQLQFPWDPNRMGADVFNTTLLRRLPECVKVFVPESVLPMQTYPGVSGRNIDKGIAWCAQQLILWAPNSDDFRRIEECLEVLFESNSATISFRGAWTMQFFAQIGIARLFAQAYRLATHPNVMAYLAQPNNRNDLMVIAANASRSDVIDYMLVSDQIARTQWWPFLDFEVLNDCISKNYVSTVVRILQQWNGLIAELNNNGFALLETAIQRGRTPEMAEYLLEHEDDIPYHRATVLYLMNLCVDRVEGGALAFDRVRETLNEWHDREEYPDDNFD